jgi:hypothetical protein
VGRASLRFAAGHDLGREKPVNADLLTLFPQKNKGVTLYNKYMTYEALLERDGLLT